MAIILRCATSEEYAHWRGLNVVPKLVINPPEAFCTDALAGDVGWCLTERQAGRCCRDAATFRRLTRKAKGMELAVEPATPPPPAVITPTVPTYTYPVTETVHAVDVLYQRTYCGIPLMGFTQPVPRWGEQFNAASCTDAVSCKRCRYLADLDDERTAA